MPAAVVVLDDDKAIQMTVERTILEFFPGTAVHTHDEWSKVGPLLFRLLKEHSTVLLLCDLHMPGIRGSEFCAIVRKCTPNVKMIVITGSDEAPTRRELNKAGLGDVDIFIKSGGPQALARMVEPLLIEGLDAPGSVTEL